MAESRVECGDDPRHQATAHYRPDAEVFYANDGAAEVVLCCNRLKYGTKAKCVLILCSLVLCVPRCFHVYQGRGIKSRWRRIAFKIRANLIKNVRKNGGRYRTPHPTRGKLESAVSRRSLWRRGMTSLVRRSPKGGGGLHVKPCWRFARFGLIP